VDMLLAQPTYSARWLKPYLRLLREYPDSLTRQLVCLKGLDMDDRVPFAVAHEFLARAIRLTRDPHLGLKAVAAAKPSDYGVLGYAVQTAASCGQALTVISQCARLFSDALDLSSETHGDRTYVRLANRVALPQPAVEYQVGLFHNICVPAGGFGCEVLFEHPCPIQIHKYLGSFGASVLRFGAPFDGFVFPSRLLSTPIQGSNPHLFSTLLRQAKQELARLPKVEAVSELVRELVARDLDGCCNVRLADVARRLHMSRSKLCRALAAEGTSFTALVDESRLALAKDYLLHSDMGVAELACLLGYSESSPFCRAFKRWTSVSPLEYRITHRGERQNAEKLN
jgi:AraC-like DNA-binding protein